ncbi:hypothetical protein [Nocardia wallacei]|uniref:hypothetical protein n=1 Tax=Nocardia wallacei TaxID=480035 RepID=UPI0024542F10|nr:hypothetical protein [Nocardia wallacei]
MEPASGHDLRHLTDAELDERIRQLDLRLALGSASDAVLFRWTRTDSADFDRRLQQHRLAADAERSRIHLEAARAEHQRRRELPDDQRTAEDQERADREARKTRSQSVEIGAVGIENDTGAAVSEELEL